MVSTTAPPCLLPGELKLTDEQDKLEKKHAAQAWNASPEGRAAIRLFSRGLLGCAAFTFGGWYASRSVGLRGYNPEATFGEMFGTGKPLNVIAKGIDTVFGEPIKAVANFLGHDGEALVRFRPTSHTFNGSKTGRSLGEEAVGITFDFAMASYGDALGRDLADIADPNIKKDWINKDGSIDTEKAVKGMGKAAWRYLTYNGGEDWAVAVPYAFWMKGTRNLMNKIAPGFMYDFDRALNGGSFKVNQAGDIVGNFGLAGMVNLAERFTVYNIGTLMYREAYNHVGHKLSGEKTALYGSPDKAEDKGFVGNTVDLAKWAARSAVKATTYMLPAVPFFFATRTPQSKYKGTFINPETEGLLCYMRTGADGAQKTDSVRASELWRHHDSGQAFNGDTPVFFSRYGENGWQRFAQDGSVRNPHAAGTFNAYERSFGVVDAGFNALGKFNNDVARFAQGVPESFGATNPIQYTRLTNRFVNAAFAYTPYMYAKAELARAIDNGKMDLATERLVDGAFSLNWQETKKGAREVWQALWNEPFDDPERETEGCRRIRADTSAAADTIESTGQQFKRLATPHPMVNVEHAQGQNTTLKTLSV